MDTTSHGLTLGQEMDLDKQDGEAATNSHHAGHVSFPGSDENLSANDQDTNGQNVLTSSPSAVGPHSPCCGRLGVSLTENPSHTGSEEIMPALSLAARNGHSERVGRLLDHAALSRNCPRDVREKMRKTALVLAVLHGQGDCVQYLMKARQTNSTEDASSETGSAFLLALGVGHAWCAMFLFNQARRENHCGDSGSGQATMSGDDVNFNSFSLGLSSAIASFVDVSKGDITKADLFLGKDFSTNNLNNGPEPKRLTGSHIATTGKYGVLAVIADALKISSECVHCLIDPDPETLDICTRKQYRKIAVVLAALNGHSQCVKNLLQGEFSCGISLQVSKAALLLAVLGNQSMITRRIRRHCEMYCVEKNLLLLASMYGYGDCVKCLIASGQVDVNCQSVSGWTALMLAAEKGQIECVESLLSTGLADVNKKDWTGRTAFMIAASSGEQFCLKLLFNSGKVDLYAEDLHGWNALMFAAEKGHIRCVQFILALSQPDLVVNKKDSLGRTALMISAGNGFVECTHHLLSTGCLDIFGEDREMSNALTLATKKGHANCVDYLLKSAYAVDIPKADTMGKIAFMVAAQHGQLGCLKCFVESGHETFFNSNEHGVTALILAAKNGQTGCVQYLLDSGLMEVNAQNVLGKTALICATENGHVDCVRNLLATGQLEVNKKTGSGSTALMIAGGNGDIECVKCLFSTGKVIENTGGTGFTSLMYAAKNGHIECVKYLLENSSCSVKYETVDVWNALMLASEMGRFQCVEYFLASGRIKGVVDKSDELGRTAFMLAASNGHVDCAQCLLNTGQVDVDRENSGGWTALIRAAEHGHVECVNLLLKSRLTIDINKQSRHGNTALTQASENGHVECVKMLLNTGKADVNIHTEDDNTALMLASEKGHIECVKSLLQAGQDIDISRGNRNGQTAPTLAAGNGHFDCLKILMDSGLVDIDMLYGCEKENMAGKNYIFLCFGNSDNAVFIRQTALLSALMNDKTECVKYLLSCSWPLRMPWQVIRSAFIFLAAQKNNMQCLRYYFDVTGGDEIYVNVQGNSQENNAVSTFIPEESGKGYYRYLSDITWQRPYIYDKEQDGQSVLHITIKQGLALCLICFLLGNADVPLDSNFACSHDLLDEVCMVPAVWKSQHTTLMTAAKAGHWECIDYFLQYERLRFHTLTHLFQNHFLEKKQISPTHYELLRGLIWDEREVDVVYHMICDGRPVGVCVDLLLSAYIFQITSHNDSAVSFALARGHTKCLRLLIEHVSIASEDRVCYSHIKTLFLWGPRHLEKLTYLAVFLNAGIFYWSWYPEFSSRRQRFLARELVIAGYSPGHFKWEDKLSSPLHHAFMIRDEGLVRYLVANLYLTSHDLACFQTDAELRNHVIQNGSPSLQRLHQRMYSTPWSLKALSLLTVSSSLRHHIREKDMARLDWFSGDVEIRLAFMNPIRWLCLHQWVWIDVDYLLHGRGHVRLDEKSMVDSNCCNNACRRILRRRRQ